MQFFVARVSLDPFDKRHDVIAHDPITGYQHVQERCMDKLRARDIAYRLNRKARLEGE